MFDENFQNVAQYANLVLDDVTLQMLQHITTFSDEELKEALDKVAPGTNSRHTLLYGVETKFYSSRLALSSELESQIPNFFAAGDGAGVTRGLAQASAAGIIVARAILKREKGE